MTHDRPAQSSARNSAWRALCVLVGRTLRSLISPSRLGSLAVLALVALHLPRLISRLRDASIVEPGVLLRWLLVPVVLAAFVALRRRGMSLMRGRAAVAVWLLVLLIHAAPMINDGAHDLLIVAPVALALLAAVAEVVRRLAPAIARGKAPRRAPLSFALPASPAFAFAGFLPRPPPAAAAAL